MAARHLPACCRVLLLIVIGGLWIILIRHGEDSSASDTSNPVLSNSEHEILNAVDEQRLMIAEEMNGFNYFSANSETVLSLEDLVPDLGGQPLINLIVTTWRSGSTFLGELVNRHPGNYYHYEPLAHLGVTQVRKERKATNALNEIESLLGCNYTGLGRYLQFSKKNSWQFGNNERMWKVCNKHRDICWTSQYLWSICRLFPFQSLKIIRLRLKSIEKLLQDSSALDLRVVLLVRDPRGTMNSRKDLRWCRGRPDCDKAQRLCADLEDDYEAAVDLNQRHPHRLKIIRFDEFSDDPYTSAQDLFQFFRLDFHPNVIHFLETHTNSSDGKAHSTYRDSKSAPFHWRQEMSHEEVLSIQKVCKRAMELWGYIPALNSTHQLEFNPVGDFFLR